MNISEHRLRAPKQKLILQQAVVKQENRESVLSLPPPFIPETSMSCLGLGPLKQKTDKTLGDAFLGSDKYSRSHPGKGLEVKCRSEATFSPNYSSPFCLTLACSLYSQGSP